MRQGRVRRITARKAQVCCPPVGSRIATRRFVGIGYQLPPSSGMAEPDGPSVSLNGVVVALLQCDRTRSASASFNNVVVTILRCGRMDASLVALQ